MNKKEYRKQYYLKNKELIIARAVKWKKDNPEKYSARMKAYYIRKCEDIKKRSKGNYHSQPLVERWAQRTIYAHRTSGITVNILRERLIEIALLQTNCQICGVELKFYKGGYLFCKDSVTLDRINNGPMIDESNMLIICSECNMTKGTRKFKDFIDYCKMVAERDWSGYGVKY